MYFSRTAHCEKCEKAKRPENGDFYSVIGSTHQVMEVIEVKRVNRGRTPLGFTPHYFWTEKVKGETVIVNLCCGILGCGVKASVRKEGKAETLVITLLKAETRQVVMPIKEWNAIVLKWKQTGYEL